MTLPTLGIGLLVVTVVGLVFNWVTDPPTGWLKR